MLFAPFNSIGGANAMVGVLSEDFVSLSHESVSCLSCYEISTTIIELLDLTHLIGNCVYMRHVVIGRCVKPIYVPRVKMTLTCIKCW